MQWFVTKTGYININKYTDIYVGKTSAKQYCIYAQDYNSEIKPRELDLGIFNERVHADIALLRFMEQHYEK